MSKGIVILVMIAQSTSKDYASFLLVFFQLFLSP